MVLLLLTQVATAFADYQSTVLGDDPTVYLRLGERSGTSAASLGRHGGSATINGNPVLGVYGALESDTTGDRAMRFDGDGDSLDVIPSPGSEARESYTVEAWVKLDDNRGGQAIFGGPNYVAFDNWRTTVWSGTFFYGIPTVGTWHHVAMTVTGSTMEWFVDGVSWGTHAFFNEGLLYDDDHRLTIGAGLFGSVDEVAAYDRVLPVDRIAEHHRAGAEGFGAPAPTSTTAPAVTGSATVGAPATCDDGEWANGPRTFTYRWLRDGAPIAGATTSAYTLSADDLGHSITCEVTAKNAAGESTPQASGNAIALPGTSAVSSYRDLVLADNPKVYLPLDDRDAASAENLGAHGGDAAVHGNPGVDAYGAVESDAPSDRSYRLDGDDHLELRPAAGSTVERAFSVEAWIKLDDHTSESRIFNNGAYLALNAQRTLIPSYFWWRSVNAGGWHHFAMTVRPDERDRIGAYELFIDGESVGVNQTPWPAPDNVVYADGKALRIGESLKGYVDEVAVYDYVLSRERIGEHVRRAREGFGAGVPTITTAPTVTGTADVGTGVSCDDGTWSGGPRTFSFRWLRSGARIPGATDRRYVLSADDIAHDVTCEVVASNRAGDSTPATSSNAIAMPADPPASSYAAAVLDDEPRVYLPLDSRDTARTPNLGSDGGEAIVHGDPLVDGYGAVESDTPSDRAYRLDGNDHLELQPTTGAKVEGTFTVEAWVNLDHHRNSEARVFNNGALINLLGQRTHVPGYFWWRAFNSREWHHVAFTVRADERDRPGGYELFIDGESVGTASTPWPAPPGFAYRDGEPLRIGEHLPGWVDEVAVYDYELSRERIAEHVRRAREGYGAGVPESTTAPRALGTPEVGETATCDEGDWANGPRSFAFAWLRDGTPIARATEQRYTLSADDLRHDITCRVVASNRAGASEPATSSTAVEMSDDAAADTYADLVLEDKPRVYLPLDDRSATAAVNRGSDGGAASVVGNPDSSIYGVVESDTPSDRAYRLDGDDRLVLQPSPGAKVEGAYTLEGWVNFDSRFNHNQLFSGGTSLAFVGNSSRTEVPSYWWWGAPQERSWHHVVVTARANERDTARGYEFYLDGQFLGQSWGMPEFIGRVFAYDDANPLVIGQGLAGSVDEVAVYDYVLTPERVAAHFDRARNGFGAGVPSVDAAPTVSGDAVVGRVVTCDEGTWAAGPREFSFRWLRDGEAIPRATAARYTLSADDIGTDVTCEVTAKNAAGSSSPAVSSNAIDMPALADVASYRDVVLRDRPRTYLPLSERDGTTTANLGGDGGDAAIHGNPLMGDFGALESDPLSDRSFRLDGNDSLALRPEAGSAVRGEFTIEAWVRMEHHNTTTWLFNNSAQIGLSSWRTDVPGYWWGAAVPANTWQHVAFVSRPDTRDATGTIELYIDGQLVGEAHNPYPGQTPVVYSDAQPLVIAGNLVGGLDEVAVYDYALTRERIATHVRTAREGFTVPKPTNVVPPSPTGPAVVGKTLVCEEGQWTDGPREFAYRWMRDGETIDGATDRRFTLSASDLGTSITCAVVATNSGGDSTEVASSASVDLPAAPDYANYRELVALDRPVVHLPFSTTADGMTPNVGTHGGHALLSGDIVRSGSAITGDEDPGIHLDGNDAVELRPTAGSRVSGDWAVEAWVYLDRYTWDAQLFSGGAFQRLEDWRIFTHMGSAETRLGLGQWRHIAMTMRQSRDFGPGRVQLFVDGALIGTLPATGDWLVYDDANPLYAIWHVSGAVDELAVYDYLLPTDRIEAHYGAGRDGVDRPYPVNVTQPVATGSARVGATATCEPGTWTNTPTLFEYRWTRDGSAIPGATASTYTLVADDAGRSISCSVWASNARGTSLRIDAQNTLVVPPLPRAVELPAVTGRVAPGETVTCALGAWVHGETHEVRWQLDGPDVAGLPGDRYLIDAPEGGRLRCLVRMTGPGGTSDWVASPTLIVDGTPPAVELTCPAPYVARGSDSAATFTASDAASGLHPSTPSSGSVALDTSTIGTRTVSVTARDNAGYTTTDACDYTVVHPRPGTPVASVAASADGLIELTWPHGDSPAPARYELQASDDEGATWTAVASPTARSHSFSPALADGTWRFRVRAVDPTFETEWSAVSATVFVDRTAPTVSITCPPGQILRGAGATASFTASDAGSGLQTPASGVLTLDTSAAGTHTATATARDHAGHTRTATCTYAVVNSRPGAPVPEDAASSTGLVALTWPLDGGSPEAARYDLQVSDDDGATWTDVASRSTRAYTFTTPLADGAYRFRVRAVDATFESAWSDPSVRVDVDRTAPSVSITCPTGETPRGGAAYATFTASDSGSGLVTTPGGTLTLDTTVAGTRTASVTATDRAGHSTTALCTYQVVHPRPGAPVPSSTASASGLVELTWPLPADTPEAALYELQATRDNGATWIAAGSPTARPYTLTTPLADGTWRFRVRAIDPSYNNAWSDTSTAVDVDRTPPTAAITCPTANVMRGVPASATFTASDSGSGLATPASGTIALDVSTAGSKTASVTATDRAGHSRTATCTYVVLNSRPGTPVPATTLSPDGRVSLTWPLDSGSPEAARYELQSSSDGGATWTDVAATTTRAYTYSTTPLTGGTYRFRVRAVDPNFDPAWSGTSVAVQVDRTAPTVSVTCPTGDIVHGTAASASYTASDSGSGLATPSSGSASLDTSVAGTRTHTVTATDRAGHSRTASCTYRVIYRAPGAPVPSTTLSPDGRVSLTWPLASGTPEAASYALQISSDGGTTWTSVASTTTRSYAYTTTPLTDGTYRFRVRAVDPNFDPAWSPSSADVEVDRTAPTVSANCPPAEILRGTAATASYTASDSGSGLTTPASGSVALDTSVVGARTHTVTATDRAGHSTTAVCTYRVVYRRPGKPVLSSGTNPSPTGVIGLTWPKLDAGDADPASFELQVRLNGGAWSTVASPTTRTHTFAAGMTEGTREYRVRAVGTNFEATWSDVSDPIVVDKTAPRTPAATADRTADYTGGTGAWYRDSVTVSFAHNGDPNLLDGSPGSGVDTSTVPAARTFNTSGTHTASGTVRDRAGNTSAAASLTVRVDATAPTLTVICPPATLQAGSSSTITWTASDAQSGLVGPASGSVAADTATGGPKTRTFEVRDNVGHVTTQTCSWNVVFPAADFDNKLKFDRLNVINAGTTVPIRFDLGGDFGLAVFASGFPTVEAIPCGASARDRNFKATIPASSPDLSYTTTNDYTWALRVPASWVNTCRRVTLQMVDGQTHVIDFAIE